MRHDVLFLIGAIVGVRDAVGADPDALFNSPHLVGDLSPDDAAMIRSALADANLVAAIHNLRLHYDASRASGRISAADPWWNLAQLLGTR